MLNEEQKRLVEDNHNLIYYFCYKNNLEIDDWYDVFAISICKSAKSFNPKLGKFSTYAIHNFNNALREELRKTKTLKRDAVLVPLNEERVQDSYCDFDDEVHLHYWKSLVDSLIGEDKILRYYFLGYNQREIAKMCNVSQATISRRISSYKEIIKNDRQGTRRNHR